MWKGIEVGNRAQTHLWRCNKIVWKSIAVGDRAQTDGNVVNVGRNYTGWQRIDARQVKLHFYYKEI